MSCSTAAPVARQPGTALTSINMLRPSRVSIRSTPTIQPSTARRLDKRCRLAQTSAQTAAPLPLATHSPANCHFHLGARNRVHRRARAVASRSHRLQEFLNIDHRMDLRQRAEDPPSHIVIGNANNPASFPTKERLDHTIFTQLMPSLESFVPPLATNRFRSQQPRLSRFLNRQPLSIQISRHRGAL